MSLRFKLPRCLVALCCSALTLLALLVSSPRAGAVLARAITIDGPSAAILDVDGAAMAPDGSGGILYRKLVKGQAHLFVARFSRGAWQPPLEVDQGQPFPASFPTIAAGNDGRLMVVWAEPWAVIRQSTHYELMSAELDPGAERFGPAIQIDPKDIGDGTAAYPSLAMAPNGQAYVVYRVVTDSLVGSTIVPLRPGDELVSVRVAHYNGQGLSWSSLGTINTHPQLTMRHPSAVNAPVIGVDLAGNAVVVWQEPDSAGVARIRTMRIFGNRLGNPMEVSAASANGSPIAAEADAPALALGAFGEARIAYRLAGGAGSPYGGARILLNRLPAEVDPAGAKLKGTVVIGGASTPGAPSVAIDPTGAFRLAYTGDGATHSVSGDNFHPLGSPISLGSAAGAQAITTINSAGGGVTAWATTSGALPVVGAREDFPGGGSQSAWLSAPISGPLGSLVLGGSGGGDALIAFAQGPPDEQQVMAIVVKAPPGQFLAAAPDGWVRASDATIAWEATPEAFGGTRYSVLVDGRVWARSLQVLTTRLDPRGLGDGVHRIQVLATDNLGQQSMTAAVELKVDANPPEVRVRRLRGRAISVHVLDRASGAVAKDTWVSFGDGKRSTHRLNARHTYSLPGLYTLSVHSRDRVGNVLNARTRVQIG